MKNFQLIGQIDVLPLRHELQRNEALWNKHRWRTTYAGTPHVDVDDIWIRFSDVSKTSDTTNLQPVVHDVTPIWYPEAVAALPNFKPIVAWLMARVGGYELGRLLVTRIKPGGRILPHRDADGDYTNQKDGARYHVVLQGLPGSLFRADAETVNMQTGSVWWFNHLAEHEVMNNSEDDRIHLLVDLRLMP